MKGVRQKEKKKNQYGIMEGKQENKTKLLAMGWLDA